MVAIWRRALFEEGPKCVTCGVHPKSKVGVRIELNRRAPGCRIIVGKQHINNYSGSDIQPFDCQSWELNLGYPYTRQMFYHWVISQPQGHVISGMNYFKEKDVVNFNVENIQAMSWDIYNWEIYNWETEGNKWPQDTDLWSNIPATTKNIHSDPRFSWKSWFNLKILCS